VPGASLLSLPALLCLALLQAPGGVVPAAPQSRVRFHHVHYRVADPAAAMKAVAANTGGVTAIAPGLGVGVRVERTYALFERLDASDPPHPDQPPLREASAAAVRWLAARGIVADPAERMIPLTDGSAERYHHIAFAASDLDGIARTLVEAKVAVVRRDDDAVLFDAGSGLLVEIVRDMDRADAFWCPMHPDVRAPDAGQCPACGMRLVPIPPPRLGEYDLDVTQRRDARKAVTGLDLAVREPGTGGPVTRFAVVHEKTLHLFVVSRDLQYFAHLHPEQLADGSFRLAHPLAPGTYMLIADFLPEGGTAQMAQKAIIVPGPPRSLPAADESHGLRVRLATEGIAAGKHGVLTFTVEDAATGTPVTDLEPYLGAPAHMLMVRSDLGDAVHAHPEERATRGPTVSFHPVIPVAGAYRLWIQFQRGGRVSTTAFDLTVDR
jgi:hypothetical protein